MVANNLPKNDDGTFQAYAFPGGYPIYYLLADNAVICPDCANGKNGSDASEDNEDKQWRIVAADANWEDEDMICEHCNKQIECAYPADKECENCGAELDKDCQGKMRCPDCDGPCPSCSDQ